MTYSVEARVAYTIYTSIPTSYVEVHFLVKDKWSSSVDDKYQLNK